MIQKSCCSAIPRASRLFFLCGDSITSICFTTTGSKFPSLLYIYEPTSDLDWFTNTFNQSITFHKSLVRVIYSIFGVSYTRISYIPALAKSCAWSIAKGKKLFGRAFLAKLCRTSQLPRVSVKLKGYICVHIYIGMRKRLKNRRSVLLTEKSCYTLLYCSNAPKRAIINENAVCIYIKHSIRENDRSTQLILRARRFIIPRVLAQVHRKTSCIPPSALRKFADFSQ